MDAAQVYEAGGVADSSRTRRALLIIAPAGLAALYPWLLNVDLFLARASGGGSMVGLASVLGIATGCAIVALSILCARRAADVWSRVTCMLAATTPTLYVGTMNYTYLLNVFPVLKQIWVVLWLTLAVGALLLSQRSTSGQMLPRRQALATAHGIGAAAILIVFLAPHITNHVAGLWSGSLHIAIMHAVRLVYRNAAIEPLLFALVAFQIVSGLTLVAPRLRGRLPWLSTLQAMSGVYIGIFFVGHVAAVFDGRLSGSDTDWNWLTAKDAGLLSNLNRIYLVPHYWIGVIALATHLACGLRDVLLKHGFAPAPMERTAYAAIGTGALVSTLILLGLLGLHLA